MPLNIALAQLNFTVGNLGGNIRRMLQTSRRTPDADLIVFPELSITGYPPEDLLLNQNFIDQTQRALRILARFTVNAPALLVGAPWPYQNRLYNAAVLLQDGAIKAVTAKRELPNYGVFDEQRYFTPGGYPLPIDFKGYKLGVMICEDIWFAGGARALKERGAQIFVVLNSSPYQLGKPETRLNVAAQRCRENRIGLVYVNMVGGQDELVFDGRSFVLSPNGQPEKQLTAWFETVEIYTFYDSPVRLVA